MRLPLQSRVISVADDMAVLASLLSVRVSCYQSYSLNIYRMHYAPFLYVLYVCHWLCSSLPSARKDSLFMTKIKIQEAMISLAGKLNREDPQKNIYKTL